jgi:hypothetical protein
VPNIGSASRTLSPWGRRALLLALSILARLPWTATVAAFTTAARPATPPALTATYMTPGVASRRVAEVAATPITATPADAQGRDLGVSLPRPDQTHRRGYQGSTGELYGPSPGDRAGIQTRRQLVEGAGHPSFFSPHQQRNSSFQLPERPYHLHTSNSRSKIAIVYLRCSLQRDCVPIRRWKGGFPRTCLKVLG